MKIITKYLLSGLIIFSFLSYGEVLAQDRLKINARDGDNFLKLDIPLNSDNSSTKKKPKVQTKSQKSFNDSTYFPGKKIEKFQGIGTRGEVNGRGDSQMLLYYIPTITNILLWIIAPLVVGILLFSGVQFIYSGDDEEQLSSSKKFFQYGVMGIIFIFVSYSLMNAVYNIMIS